MTDAAALAFFGLELGRALAGLGSDAKLAVVVLGPEDGDPRVPLATVAYVVPATCAAGFDCEEPQVAIFRWALLTYDKRQLQCVARHEASHIALGHVSGSHSQEETDLQEQGVAVLMRLRWRQDSACGLR